MNIHASAVAFAGKGLLIRGPSGAGKSVLALQMIALGGILIADDRTEIRLQGQDIVADAPAILRGRIEARGVGILSAEAAGPTPIRLVVDLGQAETERLPPERHTLLLGMPVPLVFGPLHTHLAVMLSQYLNMGRVW